MPLSQVSQFRNRANVGLLALAFVVILITSIVSVRSIDALRGSIGWIGHTMQVKDKLAQLQQSLGRTESAGLRFMVDGLSLHRESLLRHLQEVGARLAELKPLIADNPEHVATVAALAADYRQLVERARQSIAIKDADARDGGAALRRLRDGRGEPLVERMYARIERMKAVEAALLARRQSDRDTLVKQTNATLLIANGLALFAGLIGFFALRRAQREAENTLLLQLRATQARRASEEKSHFLANMSHEIRTPMNAIFGFAQLLADNVDEPLQREWVASIRKSGQVLLSLINDVLDVSKIEAGKMQLNPQGTDVAELIDETVSLFAPMAEAKGLWLRCEIARDAMVPVSIDAQRLRQILMNLVSNAVKYTERGGVAVSAEMQPSPLGEGRDLRIRVQDTGTGIAADEQERIFDPFYQAQSPDGKQRQGTGLGLSVTRLLATLMQGRIHVLSRPGEGALFQIDLPDLPRAEPDGPSTGDPGGPADFDRLPPLRILLVDDVDWNVDVARGYLRGSHHQIAIARDGLEALSVAQTFRPDVVLMDLRMPRLDGYTAAERLRADPATRHARVIAVTASSLVDERVDARVAFDGYVRKPYAPGELLGCLLGLFGHRAVDAADAVSPADGAATDADAVDAAARREEALAEWSVVRGAPLEAMRMRMRIREIGEFSRRLDALSEAIGDTALREDARQLHLAVQRFDVTRVKAVLDRLAHRDAPDPASGVRPHAE